MGLLSDPEYGSMRFIKVLKRIHYPLCFLFYIGAIVWFFLLANREFNNETYFSENALLPGLVTNEFYGEQAAKQFYNEFLLELEDKYEDTDEMPVPWLVGKMSQLHLEVYTHNFTLNYPLGQGQVFKGTNVYGILRAARTSSLEALVLTAPYRPLSSHQKGTAAGIALMLAFAQFARPKKYWAKDIIFLVTEHEQLGMQAWLEAYHGLQSDSGTFYTNLGSFYDPSASIFSTKKSRSKRFEWWSDHSKCLNPGTLKGRSGSIQAAINLEFHTPKIKYVEVKVEGLNGQLPNLDLVNLVHKLCVKSGIHHSYKNSYAWLRNRNMDAWVDGIWTMLGMMSAQIAGVPNGNHGLFHRFGIEAVTLEGRDTDDPSGTPPRTAHLTPANFYRLGNALESIFRSLNNLLERFHQSYFFYLLAATDRFISIGQYMPSLCLLCGALLIRALSLWVTIQKDEELEKKKEKDTDTNAKDTDAVKDTEIEKDTEIVKDSDAEEKPEGLRRRVKFTEKKDTEKIKDSVGKKERLEEVSVVSIGANYFLVHLIGYGVMNSPILFSYIGAKYFDKPSEVSVYYGLLCMSVLIAVTAPLLLKLFRSRPINRDELTIINILLLIEMSTACLCVGMHNISLGLCLSVLYTPLGLLVDVGGEGRWSKFITTLKRLVCLLLQPLIAVTLAMMLYSRVLFPEEGIMGAVGRGRDAAMQGVMFAIVDSLIYGNWLFNVVTAVLLPTWIISWQILCTSVTV
ncbi:glycosylphosphatidylinositol anchor attachment 1 protein [Colias croceus]|uniref:glycosylphosphatidylinositol anchor attachment 1 protein n=1 Tax=Colias crocea TaxID=72248 RepID=UPI001E27F350|nr:glycosylphosphatidylinositol anchor attachment 1 protein [Colias croceus]